MVTLDIAKLLYENAYNKKSFACYAKDFFGKYQLIQTNDNLYIDPYEIIYMAPTHLEVEDWLLERGVYIQVYLLENNIDFSYIIFCDMDRIEYDNVCNCLSPNIKFNTKREATEDAIKESLKILQNE